MPDSCMTAAAAKYLPEMVTKCKLPKKHKKTVEGEDEQDEQGAVLQRSHHKKKDADSGSGGGGYIPGGGDYPSGPGGKGGQGGQGCMALKTKHKCLKVSWAFVGAWWVGLQQTWPAGAVERLNAPSSA
jgi:hypothetical protein